MVNSPTLNTINFIIALTTISLVNCLAETTGENEIATDIELKIIRRHNKKLREVDEDTTSTTVGDYIIYLKYIRKKVHMFS